MRTMVVAELPDVRMLRLTPRPLACPVSSCRTGAWSCRKAELPSTHKIMLL